MSDVKFGADLYPEGSRRIGGHIIITDDKFIWKPVKFLFWGNVPSVEIPINDLVGYIKEGTTLYIGAKYTGVEGNPEFMAFYVLKGQSIIDAIKNRNPSFRMFATNEYSMSSSSGSKDYIWFILAIIVGILYAVLKG